jgi:hypothetical protein
VHWKTHTKEQHTKKGAPGNPAHILDFFSKETKLKEEEKMNWGENEILERKRKKKKRTE